MNALKNSLSILLLVVAVLNCASCDNRYGVEVTLINKRDTALQLSSSHYEGRIPVLQPKESIIIFLDFKDVGKADGSYNILVGNGGKGNGASFYYSNGAPLEHEVKLTFVSDSVIVERDY